MTCWPLFLLQLVVRHPDDPSYLFEWGSLYMVTQDYMKAKECYHDAVSISQSHLPRLQMLQFYFRPAERADLAFFELRGLYSSILQPDDVWSPGHHVSTKQRCPDLPGESHRDWPSERGSLDTPGWDLSSCCQYRIIFYYIKNLLSLLLVFKVVFCIKKNNGDRGATGAILFYANVTF